MSHIDSYNHSNLGTLYGIPLYHPLEDIEVENLENPATPSSLLLGGGSGEHEIMVIRNLSFCFFSYIEFIGEQNNIELEELFPEYDFYNSYYFSNNMNSFNNLEYIWSIDDVAELKTIVQSTFNQVNLSFNNHRHYNTETKINIMIGDIICQYAIHLLNIHETDFLTKIEKHFGKNTLPHWNAINLTNSLDTAGKYCMPHNGKMEVVWGLCFKDENLLSYNSLIS